MNAKWHETSSLTQLFSSPELNLSSDDGSMVDPKTGPIKTVTNWNMSHKSFRELVILARLAVWPKTEDLCLTLMLSNVFY